MEKRKLASIAEQLPSPPQRFWAGPIKEAPRQEAFEPAAIVAVRTPIPASRTRKLG